jgi:hypothetical protein
MNAIATESAYSINDYHRKAARKSLGNLSRMTMMNLTKLYVACMYAEETWLDAFEDDGRTGSVITQEMDRLFYMQEAIVDEVRKRPTPDNDELERAHMLIGWFDKLERDDEGLYALYQDVIKSVEAIHPKSKGTISIAAAHHKQHR